MSDKNKTLSGKNRESTCAAELDSAEKELIELREKINTSGAPPHADYWNQSLYEAEERLRLALACRD
ncbi:hypothetical protein PS685_00620 [Pseudomonas fluorescens]|uniref:Uncharacterized protein n=1 Tax=Pseudomonas fluorescens TaxID=294 RepID=A0A5E6YCU9_PSEFL|nr:hypothetical protein [Pseudomonas fluorescens]VVN51296.1 hypothetical protein PS685_00620 [Pseudomonas fluorescens]